MSGIAALWHLDQRPVNEQDIARICSSIDYRGPDRAYYWTEGPIGLGQNTLQCTVEDDHSAELTQLDQRLYITFDGRLYNREKLLSKITLELDPHCSDGEIALACFKRWGHDAFEKLNGDFALIIWDQRERKFICARDILGCRPLYYYHSSKVFVAGSDIKQLFSATDIPNSPNLGRIIEHLNGHLTLPEETIFENVYSLAPAHYLEVSTKGVSTTRYWDITAQANLEYRTQSDYSEHFYQLFRDAVSSRLHSSGPIGVYLSGGLDSSSVAAMAADIFAGSDRVSNIGNSRLRIFSMIFPDRSCDESEYIRAVEKKSLLDVNYVKTSLDDCDWVNQQIEKHFDFPDFPTNALAHPLRQAVSDQQVRVILSGIGADEILTGGFHPYASLLNSGNLLHLFAQLFSDPRRYDLATAILPRQVKHLISKSIPSATWFPRWLDSELIEKVNLPQRLNSCPGPPKEMSIQKQKMYKMLSSAGAIYLNQLIERSAAFHQIEERHPFRDRALIEFCFRVPERQLEADGRNKLLLRNSMSGLLPTKIVQRDTKADFSYIYPLLLKALGGRSHFENLVLYQEGWLKKSAVLDIYDKWQYLLTRTDNRESGYTEELWTIVAVNALWKSIFLGN